MRNRRFTNDDVESWMMSEGVDSIANYLRAGRIYEALSTEDLAKQYIGAIRCSHSCSWQSKMLANSQPPL